MSVFYKFKSALTYDTIQFDDLHISLQDFKKAVIQQKQFGKNTNFDLQVTNAETNEVYTDENSLIPKNSSLILIRVPLSGTQKKTWEGGDHLSKIGVLTPDYPQESPGNMVVRSADLASSNASEEEKIQAMMYQSTVDYDPANYARVRGGNQFGEVPPNYTCHKCDRKGHWIKDCPTGATPDIKKSSGIPLSFMTPVDDPTVDGALMTPSGTFAVPTIDMQAYKEGKKEKPFIPFNEAETPSVPTVPEDLQCSLCKDLLTDAVMMSCCAESFCDECIRNALLESEDNQCPECKETEISPEKLIPCLYLRKRVNAFKNDNSYNGGQRPKPKVVEPSKSPVIEHDQDVEIIETVPVESTTKVEQETEGEKGNAIVVLGSGQRGNRIQTNGGSKLPTIHVEHRPPQGRPKGPSDIMPKDTQRTIVGNGVRSSPDLVRDIERNKSSPNIVNVSHPAPVVNRITVPPPVIPNMSQLPPGFSQQTMQPIGTHFAGNVGPMLSTYGPPPGVNPMVVPPHLPPQSSSVRMYPPYSGQSAYSSQMGGAYRGMPGPHRVRMHHPDTYSDRNLIDDPLELFERHLREKDKQDRLRRNRSRRTRSRSPRKSRSRSRQRSRSRSPSKKRSHSKSPHMARKESPQSKRDSRSPGLRRSKSKSRSRTRLRSRSRSIIRNSLPRSKSRTPIPGSKKKRSLSMSPSSMAYKKRSRSSSPLAKKPMRLNRTRSRTRSRSRSKSVSRPRKRRRTRSRSRSMSSRRSISRGRSYSRSISPRNRSGYSPNYTYRTKRHSRSPSRHHFPPRHRGGNYRDSSPYQASPYYESNEYRGYKRGGRNSRFSRGYGRYPPHQDYDPGNKYDRYGNADRYEDKRFPESNIRGYYANEHSKPRKHYYQPPNEYDQFTNSYSEVAPPGTVDVLSATGYSGLSFNDNPPPFNDRTDKYRRTPEHDDRNSHIAKSNYKESIHDDYKKARDEREKEHDHHRRRSRERHGHHSTSYYSEYDRNRRHGSRTRVTSTSPSDSRRGDDRKHRSRGRSADKENKPFRNERASSRKRDSVESVKEERLVVEKQELSADVEKTKPDVEEKKEEYKEKKEKSKKKKKKDSEVDKKKKKKVKSGKKEDEVIKIEEEKSTQPEQHEEKITPINDKKEEVEAPKDDLYGDIEDTKVDTKIIENYGKIESIEPERPKNENIILAAVPELSKWEREDIPSPSDDPKIPTKSSNGDDKKVVTSEILKRAENALFQKAIKATARIEIKTEVNPTKEKEEIQVVENAREARKSGNSIQVTVPVGGNKSEDENRSSAPSGRISAKDRLGAKVDDRNFAAVRSLVEPKTKPRSLQSTVKSVVDMKHVSKSESCRLERSEKPERSDKPDRAEKIDKLDKKEDSSKKHEEKRKKESRHSEGKHSKRRESKDKEKSKHSRKSSEEEGKTRKENAKEKDSVKVKLKDETAVENKKDKTPPEKPEEKAENKDPNDVKSQLDKKRPCLDEASFEPDYDLTSESEGENSHKVNPVESNVDTKKISNVQDHESKPNFDKALIQKMIEHTTNMTSSDSSTDSSSETSTEQKKRKKRKSKKRKKTKKRKTYSSESESEESSESDSDSDTKHKKKKKHRHKTKKSKSAKKKKKNKHK